MPAPAWAPLGASPLGCPTDRVTNAGAAIAFGWQSCDDGTPACEELVFNGPPEAISVGALAWLSIRDDGEGPRLALAYQYPNAAENYILFTDDGGHVLDGYRSAQTAQCGMWTGSVAKDQHGVLVANAQIASPRIGGLLSSFPDKSMPTPFEVTPAPKGYGPQDHPMSPSRWLWQYAYGKVVSVSTSDGGDLRTMVSAQQAPYDDVLDAHRVVAAGDLFFIAEVLQTDDAGDAQGVIVATDGVAQPQPYLRASDGSWYDEPVFANSHVAWARGVGFIDVNQYTKVEIWASAFSADPAGLAPFKVDDYALGSAQPMVGGWGTVAVPSNRTPQAPGECYVYNLRHKTRATFTLPDGRGLFALMGLTKTHFYAVSEVTPDAPDFKIVRFALPE